MKPNVNFPIAVILLVLISVVTWMSLNFIYAVDRTCNPPETLDIYEAPIDDYFTLSLDMDELEPEILMVEGTNGEMSPIGQYSVEVIPPDGRPGCVWVWPAEPNQDPYRVVITPLGKE